MNRNNDFTYFAQLTSPRWALVMLARLAQTFKMLSWVWCGGFIESTQQLTQNRASVRGPIRSEGLQSFHANVEQIAADSSKIWAMSLWVIFVLYRTLIMDMGACLACLVCQYGWWGGSCWFTHLELCLGGNSQTYFSSFIHFYPRPLGCASLSPLVCFEHCSIKIKVKMLNFCT